MIRIVSIAAVATSLVLSAGVPAAETSNGVGPRKIIRQITDEVLAILRDDSLAKKEKQTRIENVVYAHVDFEIVSRLVLARNWRKLDEPEQKEFVREFRRHLSLTYGTNVDSYRDERVTITGDRKEARRDWTVQTRVIRNGPNDIFVDYRLREVDGEWKIIDVIVERVSLVSNFRSQFQDILSKGGPERLLEVLRKKNEEGASGLES